MISERDEYYMRVALAYAQRGLGHVAPNPSVGCVLVQKDNIIAAAYTARGGRPHAETQALAASGALARGATAYVTLEPCSHTGQTGPCAQALIDAGIARVVVAAQDPDPRVSGRGLKILTAAGLVVENGVLEKEALALNAGFIQRVTNNRPLVTGKMAISKDGKIAAGAGRQTFLSGALAQRHTHLMRSYHDAIMVGIGTVLVDNPSLTTRLPGHFHITRRIVLDQSLRIPIDCKLVQTAQDEPVWIVCDQAAVDKSADKVVELQRKGCELIVENPHQPDAVLRQMAARGVTRILLEGGAQVMTGFLQAGCVDEFALTHTPHVLGQGGLDALDGADIFALAADFGFENTGRRKLNEDYVEFYRRAP